MIADVNKRAFRAAFIGGGSGGHLFPGIAIAEQLRLRLGHVESLFLTSTRTVDAEVLAAANAGNESCATRVEPYIEIVSGSRFTRGVRRVARAIRAMQRAKKLLRDFAPDVVIGLGAFASLPGVIAASRLQIPIVLLELNVIPGRANRSLASRAALTIAGFAMEESYAGNWPGPVEVLGVPLRSSIQPSRWRPPLESNHVASTATPQRLLILGGSQGARRLNHIVISMLAADPGLLEDWDIVHQTGETDLQSVTDAYARQGRPATVAAFMTDLPGELSKATLVISRAGAGTVHELAACRCPSILIPLSSSADDHQRANAAAVAEMGGAIVIDERSNHAASELRTTLLELTASSTELARTPPATPSLATTSATTECGLPRLNEMSAAISRLARPDAAAQAAALIVAVANGRNK